MRKIKFQSSKKKSLRGIKIQDFNNNVIETSKDGISIKSIKDITIDCDGSFKINAKKDVNIKTDKDITNDGKALITNLNLNFQLKVVVLI